MYYLFLKNKGVCVKKIFFCLLLSLLLIFVSCSSNPANDKQSVCVDSKTVNVYTPAEYLKGDVDKVVISDSLLGESNASRRSFDVEYSKSENGFSVVYHDLKYYGKHKLVAKYYSGSTLLGEEVQNVTATASEYNMPCLIATVPVTDYTLMAVDSYREDYFNSNLPTIITLERAQAYNWDNLPDNMQVCPFLSDDWIENGVYANNWNYETAYSIYWEYVEYLYNLNSHRDNK